MDATSPDALVAGVASAIAEPARTRILFCLLDGHARTATELAAVAEVTPSTSSVHLARLLERQLVKVVIQGKYRYYSLADGHVAKALEALSVVAGLPASRFTPNTPVHLRTARSCYDHIAGSLGVALHDRLLQLGWLTAARKHVDQYALTEPGERGLQDLGVNLEFARTRRRRFAYACLDWSERRPHLGGALGAALMQLAVSRRWVARELDSRALRVTAAGGVQLRKQFGVEL
ncbi:MAG: ArsR/SmtB family transcription factor [Gammaproteobacteria bacterium]